MTHDEMAKIIVFASLLTACADSHQIIRDDTSSVRLTLDDTIFISVPSDGVYGANIYRGSGHNTA